MLKGFYSMSRIIFSILFFTIFVASGLTAQVTVTESSNELLRLIVTAPEIEWDQSSKNGIVLNKPLISGFVPGGLPKEPSLPVTGRWIVIPDGKKAILAEVSSTWKPVQRFLVTPNATPVMREGEDGESWLGQELLLPGELPVNGMLFEPSTRKGQSLVSGVKLGEPVKWRGRFIQPLTIVPLDVSVDGYARAKLVSGVYEIRFKESNLADESYSTSGDAQFSSMFINPELLDQSGLSTARVPTGYSSRNLLAPEVRLPVTDSRLHRVTASSLKNYGLLDVPGLMENQIRLYQRRYNEATPESYTEIEVPIKMVGDGNAFDGDDYFVFFGLRLRDDPDAGDPLETYNPTTSDPVNSGNIYYLSASDPDESWARMENVSLNSATGDPLASYRRVELMHEDNAYAYRPYNRNVDRNRWNARSDSEVNVSIPVYNPVESVGNVRLTAELFSFASTPRQIEIWFGDGSEGTPLSTRNVVQSGTQYDSGAVLSSDLLVSGLRLKCNRLGINSISAYLNKFTVEYDARFEVIGDRLDFNCGTEVGIVPVELTGFVNDRISLFELTDPHNPINVELDTSNILPDGDNFKVSINADNQGGESSVYYVVGGDPANAIFPFSYNRASVIENPVDPTLFPSEVDLFVITHPNFSTALEPWVQHRIDMSGGDLVIQVMDVHSVYDWFSGGVKTPEAIRRAIQFAKNQNGAWAVQLVGDANENVRSLGDTNLRDWVPSRWHCWTHGSYSNEMLPSDKWFVVAEPGENFPYDTGSPAEILIGRFPCNSPDQLTTMTDKVIAFETAPSDAAWKKRGLFLADDAWSSGYGDYSSDTFYIESEDVFEEEERYAAQQWSYVAGSKLDSVRVFMEDTLGPLVDPPGSLVRDASDFQDYTYQYVYSGLFDRIDAGASVFRYQGHANDYVLAHEYIIQDTPVARIRVDTSDMNNNNKPWIFFGFGCHISTWAKDAADMTTGLPSLAEKMLFLDGSGAVATYASSGYEFSGSNGAYSRVLTDIWMNKPPKSAGQSSKWMLGQLLQASDAEFIALHPTYSNYRKLIAQFCLLGDPLMIVDCGSPDLYVTQDGQPLNDGQQISVDQSNEITLELVAADEAGVDRIYISDSQGEDLSEYMIETTPDTIFHDAVFGTTNGHFTVSSQSDQIRTWEFNLPVKPYDHEVIIDVYDSADAADSFEHSTFTLSFPVSHYLTLAGEQFDPEGFSIPEGSVLDFNGQATVAAWVSEDAEFQLTGQNLLLSNDNITRVDGHTVEFNFDVELPLLAEANDRSVILSIDGYATEMIIEYFDNNNPSVLPGIGAFPNPTSGTTRFVFHSADLSADGRIVVWDVAGNQIAALSFSAPGNDAESVVISWDGRDSKGDAIANGVYLYRAELFNGVASEMQKLVVMH
jgi:hypothetical protein